MFILDNLSITWKVGFIVIAMALVSIGSGANSALRMSEIDDAYSNLIDRIGNATVNVAQAGRIGERYVSLAYQLAAETTDEGNARLLAAVRASQQSFAELIAKSLNSAPEKADVIQPVERTFTKAFQACEPAVDFASKTSNAAEVMIALARLKSECDQAFAEAQ